MTYAEFYRRSVDEPEAFWGEQARLIDWQTPPQRILDNDKSPFTRWFVGATTPSTAT
jgi:propionyl-CoA synthetase